MKDKKNWAHASKHDQLTEDEIREHKDEVSWYYVSWNQELSEEFMKEFQDEIYWSVICQYQYLSGSFILANWKIMMNYIRQLEVNPRIDQRKVNNLKIILSDYLELRKKGT